MDTFRLTIELGNDAMQTGGDVADALRKLADQVDTRRGGQFNDGFAEGGNVRDDNGNTVGSWSVVETHTISA